MDYEDSLKMTGNIWLVFSWLSANPHSLNRSTSSIFDCLPFVAIITGICETTTCTVHNSNIIVHNIFLNINKIKPHAIWLFFIRPQILISILPHPHPYVSFLHITNKFILLMISHLKIIVLWAMWTHSISINVLCMICQIAMQSVIKSCVHVKGIYTYW